MCRGGEQGQAACGLRGLVYGGDLVADERAVSRLRIVRYKTRLH